MAVFPPVQKVKSQKFMKLWCKRKPQTGWWRFVLIDCLCLVSGCHIMLEIFYEFFKKQVFPGTDVLDEEYTERESTCEATTA